MKWSWNNGTNSVRHVPPQGVALTADSNQRRDPAGSSPLRLVAIE